MLLAIGYTLNELVSYFKKGYKFLDNFLSLNPMRMAASFSFFALMSCIPFYIVILFVLKVFYQRHLENNMLFSIGKYSSPQVQSFAQKVFSNAPEFEFTGLSSILFFLIIMYTSTSALNDIQDSLNLVWGHKSNFSFKDFFLNRVLVFFKALFLGLLFILLSFIGPILHQTIFYPFHKYLAIGLIEFLTSFIFLTLFFVSATRLLVKIKVRMKELIPGSAVFAFLFLLCQSAMLDFAKSQLISKALNQSGLAISILIWVYISAFFFLLGQHLNYSLINRRI